MKRIARMLSGQGLERGAPQRPRDRRQLVLPGKQSSKKDLLLRHPSFVAKSTDASFETPPLACEASALTTELTAQNHTYFSSRNQFCKQAVLIRSFGGTSLSFQGSRRWRMFSSVSSLRTFFCHCEPKAWQSQWWSIPRDCFVAHAPRNDMEARIRCAAF